MRRKVVALAFALLTLVILLASSVNVQAIVEDWKPASSVTIYCVSAAGGATDYCVSAAGGATDYCNRAMAQALSDYWGGVSVQVVNQPGGSGGVAASTVWNKAYDGLSVLGFSEAVFSQHSMGVFDQAPDAWELIPPHRVPVSCNRAWRCNEPAPSPLLSSFDTFRSLS